MLQSEEVSFTKIQALHFANLRSPHESLLHRILRVAAPARAADIRALSLKAIAVGHR